MQSFFVQGSRGRTRTCDIRVMSNNPDTATFDHKARNFGLALGSKASASPMIYDWYITKCSPFISDNKSKFMHGFLSDHWQIDYPSSHYNSLSLYLCSDILWQSG